MYSVIECGGFQHKITVGETLKVSKIDAKIGEVLTVANVLLYANGENVVVGKPIISEASVKMEVLTHDMDDKVISFKRKARKRYRKTIGHRQQYTEVLVTEMVCGTDKSSVDEKAKLRARARIKALDKQKVQNVPLTKAQKIAASKEGK